MFNYQPQESIYYRVEGAENGFLSRMSVEVQKGISFNCLPQRPGPGTRARMASPANLQLAKPQAGLCYYIDRIRFGGCAFARWGLKLVVDVKKLLIYGTFSLRAGQLRQESYVV